MKPARWWQLVLGNVAVFLALLLVAGAAGEVYYRFIFDSTDSFGLTRASSRWFQRHFRTNNAMVRDDVDYTPSIPAGQRRITLLGDSFTVGHGVLVEDRFANRIRREHAGEWDVQILASNGNDTGAQLKDLTNVVRAGRELDVIVLVYVLNDIADIVPEWQAAGARVHSAPEPWLVRHSYFVNELFYRLRWARDPGVRNYYGFVHDAYRGPLWREQAQRLALMAAFCEANGFRFVTVTFPFLHALGPDYAYSDVHRQLDALWSRLGVPHLDLLDLFAGRAPRELVIGKLDAHPNARAHALAAAAIDAFLVNELATRGATVPPPA
jgi:lysophospholipase L1-like esterase